MKFLIVNGVNLNLTGLRERSVYGRASLAEINDAISEQAKSIQTFPLICSLARVFKSNLFIE